MKELLAETRVRTPGEDFNTMYAAALNLAAGIIMERWATGHPSPGPGSRLVNTHLKNKQGKLVGFRIYLAIQEPIHLGPIPAEIVDDGL